MGLLAREADILPPYDDRIFKLILTSPDSKLVLIDLTSAIIERSVVDVVVRNSELPVGDTEEKAGRLDVNCVTDDGSQVDLEMQASYMQEVTGGHRNLIGKSVYYLCDLHSSQSSKGKQYDKLSQTYQVTFCAYTNIPKYRKAVNRVIASKEALQMAGNLLISVSQNERERAIFRCRRMYQSDLESNIATAEARGEARMEGRMRVEFAKKLLAEGEPVDRIVRLSGVAAADIESLL